MSSRLIVGLGNPGERYRNSRHNAGFLTLDEICRTHDWGSFERKPKYFSNVVRRGHWIIHFLKPRTYMNLSGEAVQSYCHRYPSLIDEMVVIHDDLDLDPGRIKLKRGGGDGGHKGIRSIISCCDRSDFFRVRIGIGRPPMMMPVVDYVLSESTDTDEYQLFLSGIKLGAKAVDSIVYEGIDRAMNRFNKRPVIQGDSGENK